MRSLNITHRPGVPARSAATSFTTPPRIRAESPANPPRPPQVSATRTIQSAADLYEIPKWYRIGRWLQFCHTLASYTLIPAAGLFNRIKNRLSFRTYDVKGMDILRKLPKGRAVLICANHVSYADPPLLGAAIPLRIRRRLWYIAKKSLFKNPIFGFLLRTVGVLPFQRHSRTPDQKEEQAQDTARFAGLLHAGQCVLIFPEGTTPGKHRLLDGAPLPAEEVMKLRSSVNPETGLLDPGPMAAQLAFATNALIVPVGISGTSAYMPPEIVPGGLAPKQRAKDFDIKVRVGTPIDVRASMGFADKPITPDTYPTLRDFLRWMKSTCMPAISELVDFSMHAIPIHHPINKGNPITPEELERIKLIEPGLFVDRAFSQRVPEN